MVPMCNCGNLESETFEAQFFDMVCFIVQHFSMAYVFYCLNVANAFIYYDMVLNLLNIYCYKCDYSIQLLRVKAAVE